jgi:hypothetical protein
MLNTHFHERADDLSGRLDPTDEVTFYAVSDDRFFIGMVGLINSLRLIGYEQRVVVLDCGLTEHQRNVLNPECELIALPGSRRLNPQLLKPFASLMHPKGTVVILDSDLVVTSRLDLMLQAARNGRVCVCADPESERWFAEWEQLFELPCPPRRQTYVNSGFVAFSVEHWPHLLSRWWESCQLIRSYPTSFYDTPDSPTAQADQDALNAILMSEYSEETLAVQPREVQPNMEQLRWHVRLLDVDTLTCSLHNRQVTLVHSLGKTKPFELQRWLGQGRSIYPTLLRRLLVERGVRIRVSREDVPVWLHPGRLGAIVIRILYLINRLGLIRGWLRKWRFLRWTYKSLAVQLRGMRG